MPVDRLARLTRPRWIVVGGIFMALVLAGAHSAMATFSASTPGASTSVGSATVSVNDNSGGVGLLALSNMKPGDTASTCIKVTYTGSIPATMQLFGAVTGAQGQYLDAVVTRGTSSSAYPSCSGFAADGTVYVTGQPAGVMWANTLNNYPTSGAALSDPNAASPVTWTNGTTVAYRFDVTLADSTASANTSSSATLNWQATNT